MDVFGIGPLELLLILIITLIFLGPQDMGKAGLAIGRFIRKIITSEEWRILTRASREIRNIPTKLVREAGMDEIKKDLPTPESLIEESGLKDLQKELKKETEQVQEEFSAWTKPIVIDTSRSDEEAAPAEPGTAPEDQPVQSTSDGKA